MVESQEEKIIRLTKLGETCRKIIEGEITLFPKLTEEDYNFSIGRFIKTKETIIQKRMIDSKNFHLDFNLDNNKKIIWDMLFLSEVISRQITDINTINEILTKMLNVNLFGETYTKEALTQEENDKLKKSVVIYQKTRDSMSHNSTGISCNIDKEINKIIINNTHKNSIFKCEIPFQYIEKFGSGILPAEEHKEIAKEIDNITSNIFFKLGFEMKEIPNFIYRTHPARLKLLLDKVNGNINKLKEMPREVFDTLYNDKTIEYVFQQAKGDINKIKEFPYYLYIRTKDKLSQKRLNYLIKLSNNNIFKLKKLPSLILTEDCTDERLEYILKLVNYDIEKITDIPSEMFEECWCSDKKIDYLFSKAAYDIEKIKQINLNLIRCDETRIEYLLEKTNNDFIKLTKLPNAVFYEYCPEERIEKLLKYVNNDVDRLIKIPYYLFSKEYTEEQLDKLLNKTNVRVDDLTKYIEDWTNGVNIENIQYLLEKVNYDAKKLKGIPGIIYTDNCSIERINYLLEKTKGKVEYIKELPFYFLKEKHNEERLEYLIKLTNGNIYELKRLPEIFYKEEMSTEKIEKLLELTNNNIEKLSILLFTKSADVLEENISNKRLEYIIKKSNHNIDLLGDIDLPYTMFIDIECTEERIEYLLSLVDGDFERLKEIPEVLFEKQCKKERIEHFLAKYNGNIEKLKEIPNELFKCKDEIFEEICKTHEMNMIKSLFGIGDEKLITLMVYMNTVFSNYQEEIENKPIDISKINIETIPKKIIDKSQSLEKKVEESNTKKNNVKNLTIKQEAKSTIGSTIGAIKQIPTEDKLQKDITEINNEFIRIIGNSSRHFRIYKQDENTVVLEDYTKDEQGNIKLAFRATSTIEELFNITSSLVSNNITSDITEEIVQKINIANPDKYTKEQLETINQEYEQTKIEQVKKILIQICLNKKQISNISEIKENNNIYLEYIQQNGIKVKRPLEDLYNYFKNIEPEIFNESIEEYNNYLQEKNIKELDNVTSKALTKKK